MSDFSHQGMEPGTPGDTKARGSHRDAPGAAIFAGHGAIVLVANSEDAEIERLSATLPADTLFVFFNKADRVLSKPFARDSVLVLRSGRKGPSVVLKKDLDETVALFAPGRLKHIVQLRLADFELLLGESTSSDAVFFLTGADSSSVTLVFFFDEGVASSEEAFFTGLGVAPV